jgi:hypothetical protein
MSSADFCFEYAKKIEIGVEEVIPRLEVLVWHFVVALRK